MQADSLQAALEVTPPVAFLLRGRPGGDGTQFEIVPLNLLQPNQSYTISIGRPLDVHGNAIAPMQTRFKTGPLSLARKIGYLVGQQAQPPFAVGIVDPHADGFLGRSTPKIIYSLSPQSQVTDQLLGFDWSPDSQRIAVIEAARGAGSGPIQIVDLASGTVIRPGISGSAVYWSVDGTIMYLSGGVLRRFNPATLQDGALTDLSDGRVITPVAVSPDGRSIAYTTVDADGLDHLWLMNLDLRTRYRPIGLSDPADRPAWSPNGTKLAFRRLTSAGPQLWIYDLSTSGTGSYRSGGPLDVSGVAWLNDNSTLFAATGDAPAGSLYRVNIFSAGEAGGVVKVTGGKDAPNGSSPNTPAYDRRVGFTGVVDGLPQVFVMNGDGSRPQPLTLWEADDPLTGSAPNWTPTG
jgi:Tol biopolymer transport system component